MIKIIIELYKFIDLVDMLIHKVDMEQEELEKWEEVVAKARSLLDQLIEEVDGNRSSYRRYSRGGVRWRRRY